VNSANAMRKTEVRQTTRFDADTLCWFAWKLKLYESELALRYKMQLISKPYGTHEHLISYALISCVHFLTQDSITCNWR
jgi:hypothetical protein